MLTVNSSIKGQQSRRKGNDQEPMQSTSLLLRVLNVRIYTLVHLLCE